LVAGCSKVEKPDDVRQEDVLTGGQRIRIERRRRTSERQAKDFASERMRALWDRYQKGKDPQKYDPALEKQALRALVSGDFPESLRKARRALENYQEAFPTKALVTWHHLPGTYQAWVDERARRETEDRNDPVGAKLTNPAPLEIREKRLRRLELELLLAAAELYTGQPAASYDRSRRVSQATNQFQGGPRLPQRMILAGLLQARALVELGQHRRGLDAAGGTLRFAKGGHLPDLVEDLQEIQLDLAVSLGDYGMVGSLAAEVAESAQARGDLLSQLGHLLIVARTEKLLGRWEKLEQVCGRVDDLCIEAMNAYLAEAESALYRSHLASQRGNDKEARSALLLAAQRAELAGGVDRADLLVTLADRWLQLGEHKKGAEVYEVVAGGDYPAGTKCGALLGLGKTRLISGAVDYAIEPLTEAVNLFESSRLPGDVSSIRGLWADRGAGVYETAIRQAFSSRQSELVLQLMERSRARASRRPHRSPGIDQRTSENHDRAAEIDAELARQNRFLQDVAVLISALAPEAVELNVPQIREQMEARAQGLRFERSQLRAVEGSGQSTPDSDEAAPRIDAYELIDAIDDGAVALIYFIGEEHSYVTLVFAGRLQVFELPLNAEDLRAQVSQFREAIKTIGAKEIDHTSALEWLSARLLHPIADRIPDGSLLVVVPHGPMHYLPLGALKLPNDKYLIEEHAIVVLPALGLLKKCRENNRKRLNTMLAMGNPVSGLGLFPPLPHAESEVRALTKLYGQDARMLTGDQATESAVIGLLPDFDILHFATQGKLDPQSPSNGALLFATGDGFDGRLTVREIRELRLRANLVVLSACETSTGALRPGRLVSPGDDIVGLCRAFITAGVPSVVCSLWQATDESTSQTMHDFHQHLRAGKNKAQALRAAQVTMMAKRVRLRIDDRNGESTQKKVVSGDHPFFWAPFVLFGDWN
jgi:CHAT domain-containing protein